MTRMVSRQREQLEQQAKDAFRQDLSEAEAELAQAQARVTAAQARVTSVRANYEKILEGLKSLNEQLSPHSAGASNGKAESMPESSQKVQAKDFVEPIVLEMDEDITQTEVREILIEKYPTTGARIEGSTISKVLRALEKKGVIKQIKPARSKNPAVYRRVKR